MLALTGALVVSGLLNHSPVDSSEIRPVRSDDGEMNAAMQRARDTFPEFWREVSADNQRAIPVLKGKIVKACFDDAGGASAGPEHMWVSNLQYDGQVISGVLADTPHHLRSFKKGQSVNLPLERLSDWLYVADGKAVGAFTIQVFRSHMTPQERQAHDSDYPFRFE